MTWRADLHTHTTASDGLDTPAELLDAAAQAGLSAIAIADHDTIDAHTSPAVLAEQRLEVIPAIEMSANVGTAEVHVLGYFIDVTSESLLKQLADLRTQRIARIERICARLGSIGLPLNLQQVLDQASGASVGRPHIARAMIACGYVETVGEAFDRYLSGGRPGFVPRDDVTPEWSIATIHAAGGVAVLAHPYTTGAPEQTVANLVTFGLDGMEVEYGTYDAVQREWLRDIANRHSLIPTGGSDYHGAEHREDVSLGQGWVTQDVVGQLQSAAAAYRYR